jgi:hypothetical protein
MQIGSVNSFASTSYSNKSNSVSSSNSTPIDVVVSSVFDKMSIDKKTEQKQQEIERSLTGFGKQSDEGTKQAAQAAAEMYRAILEGDLKNKISSMSLREQANKTTLAQTYNSYTANATQQQNSSTLSLSA